MPVIIVSDPEEADFTGTKVDVVAVARLVVVVEPAMADELVLVATELALVGNLELEEEL